MTGRWARAPILLFFALASAMSAQQSSLDEGIQFIREARFDEALVKLEQAHRVAPRNATIENLLGITETQLGHIREADNHYRNSIGLDPSQAAPHRNLGFNLLSSKDYTGAGPELRKASRLNPSDNFAHYYLLLLALDTKQDADALAEASHSGQLADHDADASASLVEAEIRMGSVDEATHRIEHMEDANQLTSAREYEIAILLSRQALHGPAIHCFRRIASIDSSWENRYNLALALLYGEEPVEASTLLASLHADRPANADALMFLGSAFEMQEKIPEALEAYRAAVAADPSNADRTLDYTRLLMDMDRYDEAVQVVQAGIGKVPSPAPLQLRLGAVEMVKGNYAAARDSFNAALAIDPQLDIAYVGLAQTYARQANDAEAIHILEGARDKLSSHYLLEYYFGLLASRLGREDEAIVALQKAAQLEPGSPDPVFELGKLYALRQDWPEARHALEHVTELNPRFAPAHYQLSRVYAHLDLHAESEQEAQQTHTLVDAQREEALAKLRKRGSSFQPPSSATPSTGP